MNPIVKMEIQLREVVSGISTTLDEPQDKIKGTWWLDVKLGKQHLVVQWRRHRGFGISTPDGGYGERADEVYPRASRAMERVIELLKGSVAPQPPEAVLLRRLRETRSLSQQDLARHLGISQASVSKMERESDMYISTLRRWVAAIGGELRIQAAFPELTVNIGQFTDLEQPVLPRAKRKRKTPQHGHNPDTPETTT